ncbi:MAG: hypothetical protein QOJ12_3422 [Thermoleophilales bacterium]|jgi:hypothetical protein|nr:hypothetical protein [Thermoleophilales bacterium]
MLALVVLLPVWVGLSVRAVATLRADRSAAASAAIPRPDPGVPGRTAQGEAIHMRFRHGRPFGFQTHLVASCRGRAQWRIGWTPADGAPVRFARRGADLRVVETAHRTYRDGSSDTVVSSMRAWMVRPRRQVLGWMRFRGRIVDAEGQRSACDSGWVAFEVGGARLAQGAGA